MEADAIGAKKISVILPIYNVEKYIPYTLESLKKQTYRDFEIILVDDGSPDNSVEVAETILNGTALTYKLVRQKNGGLGCARNTGMDNSSGDWVYFLDTDDIIHNDTLEKMIAAADKYDPDIVFSDFKSIGEYEDTGWEFQKETVEIFSDREMQLSFLKRTAIVLAPGTLYRRSFLYENNLRFEKIPWSEDQHFVWRVLSKIKSAAYVRAPLYGYYRREGSIMSAAPIQKMIDSYEEIKKLPYYFRENAEIARQTVPRWVLGCLHIAAIRKDIDGWNKLWEEMNGKKCMKALLTFPNIRVKIIAVIGCLSNKLLFRVLK